MPGNFYCMLWQALLREARRLFQRSIGHDPNHLAALSLNFNARRRAVLAIDKFDVPLTAIRAAELKTNTESIINSIYVKSAFNFQHHRSPFAFAVEFTSL
jgi:hypothetical protein